MFALIKPLIKLKKGLNLLDYSIPSGLSKNLKIGQLVEIPFRTSSTLGVVFDLKNESEYSEEKLKNIIKIVDENVIISKKQISFFKFFVDYNFSSLNFLNTIIPTPLKKISGKLNIEKIIVKQENINIKNLNLNISPSDKFIYEHNYFEEKLSLIKNIIDQNIKNNKQTLIISPTKNHQEKIFLNLLNLYKKNDISQIDGATHLNKTNHNQIWNNIKSNKSKIILGSKISIFYPLDNVATIIVDESEDENHNQTEINPRFEFIPNVYELSKIYNIGLIMTCYCTPLSLYKIAKDNNLKLKKVSSKINTQINLLQNDTKYFESGLDFNTENEVKNYINNNKKVLFLLNKKGYSRNIYCSDCGFVLNCNSCGSVLTYREFNSDMYCYACEKSFESIIKCPKCESTKLKTRGIGITQFKKSLEKLLEDKKSLIIDKDHLDNFKYLNTNQIIISTKVLINHIKELEFPLIVIPFSYQFLNNHFDSNEDFFIFIKKLISLKPEKIIIQAINEQDIYKYIQIQDYTNFVKKELEFRQLLKYPPFYNIIKVTIKDKDKLSLDKKVQELYNKIRQQKEVEFLEIIDPSVKKVRSFFIKHIIFKYKNTENIDNIKQILQNFDIIERNSFKL